MAIQPITNSRINNSKQLAFSGSISEVGKDFGSNVVKNILRDTIIVDPAPPFFGQPILGAIVETVAKLFSKNK